MGWANARPRVIRGTRTAPLPLLPSGPGGVCSRPLHGARDLTSIYPSMRAKIGPKSGDLRDDVGGAIRLRKHRLRLGILARKCGGFEVERTSKAVRDVREVNQHGGSGTIFD